jgi:hypothetical protein
MGFYGATPKVMGLAHVTTNFVLIVLLINTKKRTMDRPRPADIHYTAEGSLVEQMENGQSRTTSFGSFVSNFMSVPSSKYAKSKEPIIQVRIKPRAKDHPSDDFKIVVNYKVALSLEEQENLKNLVPASPMIKRKI